MIQDNPQFDTPGDAATLERVAEQLRARNIEAIIVSNASQARQAVLERVPPGAEVHSGKSKTLQEAGLTELLNDPARFDALRPRYLKMDRQTQGREIRKLIGSPDYMVGSIQAITEDGVLVTASATGSQLGPFANTAGKVIFVVGSQKIVPNLAAALQRVREYVLPWEDAQVRKVVPSGSFVGKILIIEREWVKGRMTVVLVRQPIGI